MKCEDCKWWDKDLERVKEKYEGICRRFPPIMAENNENIYPVTTDYDWCGEFHSKEIKPGAQE